MGLNFASLSYSYDQAPVLHDVSFEARRGEITCLLGPSGCGKTTLLNLAAGLLEIQAGQISLDETTLAAPGMSPPPEKRPVGLVFQDGALFPHMTVEQNVGFGLTSDEHQTPRIDTLLDQVDLKEFRARYPDQLSGGQQQRVALVRALAPRPDVVLLDEPFANIDNQLRRVIREDTRRMLRDAGTIAIMVTHDPEEAIEIADHLVIMEAGQIIQAGPPDRIYDAPETATVACMFGNGQQIQGSIESNEIQTEFGNWHVPCLASPTSQKGSATLVVRPDALDVTVEEAGTCFVTDIRSTGPFIRVVLSSEAGAQLVCHSHGGSSVTEGTRVQVSPAANSVFVYP